MTDRELIEKAVRAYWNEKEANRLMATIPEWIPVSERLPDERGLYLITFGKYDSVLDAHEAHYVNGEWLMLDHSYKFKTVRAWMPLPEPYREDDKNE